MIWTQEFEVPESPDAPFPASAVCMNYVSLPSVPGTTGGQVWVQMSDQSLTSYTGELFLQKYEWIRTGYGKAFTQFVRLTMVSPRGAIVSRREVVEIPMPYGSGFFGTGSLGNPATVFDYGAAPRLTADPPGWTLEMFTTVYDSVPGLLHYVPGVEQGPFFPSAQTAGKTLLRPTPQGDRRTTVIPRGGRLAPGIGYALGKVGKAQTLSPRFRQYRTDYVLYAIYWVRTALSGSATDAEGWNITDDAPLPPYALTMAATKLAIVRVSQSFNGKATRRDGAYYWQAEQYADTMVGGFPSARVVSTLTLGPVNMGGITTPVIAGGIIPGEFNPDGSPALYADDDPDTWPFVQINDLVWNYSVDASGNGTQYSYDVSRIIPYL